MRIKSSLKVAITAVIACASVIWLQQRGDPKSSHNHQGLNKYSQNSNDFVLGGNITSESPRNSSLTDIESANMRSILRVEPANFTEYDEQIREDEGRIEIEWGKLGADTQLAGDEKIKSDELMKKVAYNQMISDRMPYNRSLPGNIISEFY